MNAYSYLNRLELQTLVANGDQQAFQELFRQHSGSIYKVAMAYLKSKESAEEIVQDVFVKLWVKRKELTEVNNLENYLFIVAKHMILNCLRSEKTQLALVDEAAAQEQIAVGSPEQQVMYKDSLALMEHAISQLPPQQRSVFVMKRLQEMSLEEISGQLGISTLTVRNHLNQALKSVRAYMISHAEGALLVCAMMAF